MSCLAGGSGRRRLDSAGVVGQPGQRVLQPQPSITVQPFPMRLPGDMELTSSLLSLPLFSYSYAPQTDWWLSRLCAQGPGCGWKLGKETPAHGPIHYLKLGLLLSLWSWFDLWVKLYMQRKTG